MKWGLLPVSHDALLVGDMAYYDFNGEMEQEADRINLQKCLGPTCKVRLSCSKKMLWEGLSETHITKRINILWKKLQINKSNKRKEIIFHPPFDFDAHYHIYSRRFTKLGL